MNKFIELLNQYEIERGTNRVCYGIDIGVVMSEGVTYRFSYVISKEFGFIKRLVDNDKIDTNRYYIDTCGKPLATKEEKADILISKLAISDTPIEDLISYLR